MRRHRVGAACALLAIYLASPAPPCLHTSSCLARPPTSRPPGHHTQQHTSFTSHHLWTPLCSCTPLPSLLTPPADLSPPALISSPCSAHLLTPPPLIKQPAHITLPRSPHQPELISCSPPLPVHTTALALPVHISFPCSHHLYTSPCPRLPSQPLAHISLPAHHLPACKPLACPSPALACLYTPPALAHITSPYLHTTRQPSPACTPLASPCTRLTMRAHMPPAPGPEQ